MKNHNMSEERDFIEMFRRLFPLVMLALMGIFTPLLVKSQERDGTIIVHPSRVEAKVKYQDWAKNKHTIDIYLDGSILTTCFGEESSMPQWLGSTFAKNNLKGKKVKINVNKIYHWYEIKKAKEEGKYTVGLFDNKIIEFVDEAPTGFQQAAFVEDFSKMSSAPAIDEGVLAICQALLTKSVPEEALASIQKILSDLPAKK